MKKVKITLNNNYGAYETALVDFKAVILKT